MKYLIVLSFTVSLMITGDTLVMLGRFYGQAGVWANTALILACIFFAGMVPYFFVKSELSGSKAINKGGLILLDSFVAASDGVARFFCAVFLTIGLMVAAGFAFNEIFVYWFPNFGFDFALLAVLTVIQWMPEKYSMMFQLFCAATTLTGLILLIGVGITADGSIVSESLTGEALSGDIVISGVLLLPGLLFIGLDLGRFAGAGMKLTEKRTTVILTAVVIIMGILFLAWGNILLDILPREKLSHSSISHILGAKAILGHKGRIIIGAMVIMGAAAAVNGLLFSFKKSDIAMFAGDPDHNRIPTMPVAASAVSLLAAAGMAMGLAGYPELETFIKSALCLWLFAYSLKVLQSISNRRRNSGMVKDVIWFFAATVLWMGLSLTLSDSRLASWFISFSIGTISILSMGLYYKQSKLINKTDGDSYENYRSNI